MIVVLDTKSLYFHHNIVILLHDTQKSFKEHTFPQFNTFNIA